MTRKKLVFIQASARECARRRIAEEIHIANAMVENVNERVMSIVYTHCLRVYSRPVAPLRATLFDFRSDNAFMRCFFSVFLFFPNCIKDEPTDHDSLSSREKKRKSKERADGAKRGAVFRVKQ